MNDSDKVGEMSCTIEELIISYSKQQILGKQPNLTVQLKWETVITKISFQNNSINWHYAL